MFGDAKLMVVQIGERAFLKSGDTYYDEMKTDDPSVVPVFLSIQNLGNAEAVSCMVNICDNTGRVLATKEIRETIAPGETKVLQVACDFSEEDLEAGLDLHTVIFQVNGEDVNKPEEPEEPVEYRVVFDSDGGDLVPMQYVEDGGRAQEPEPPVKEGYSFAGWYLEEELYDFSQAVSENLMLKAKWEREFIPVTAIRLTPENLEVEEGASVRLTAQVLPENASDRGLYYR